jgi:hypothetical protein
MDSAFYGDDSFNRPLIKTLHVEPIRISGLMHMPIYEPKPEKKKELKMIALLYNT